MSDTLQLVVISPTFNFFQELEVFCFVSRSCDFVDRPRASVQKERSTNSHELNTKLITALLATLGNFLTSSLAVQ